MAGTETDIMLDRESKYNTWTKALPRSHACLHFPSSQDCMIFNDYLTTLYLYDLRLPSLLRLHRKIDLDLLDTSFPHSNLYYLLRCLIPYIILRIPIVCLSTALVAYDGHIEGHDDLLKTSSMTARMSSSFATISSRLSRSFAPCRAWSCFFKLTSVVWRRIP